MPFLTACPAAWAALPLEPRSRAEGVDLFHVIIERESVRDHRLAVDDAFGKQRERPFEAVQNRHRADDLDLVVVDAKRRDGGGGGSPSHPKTTTPATPGGPPAAPPGWRAPRPGSD